MTIDEIRINVNLTAMRWRRNSVVAMPYAQKEITSQTDRYLVILSSKAYVFEGKLTKY